MQSHTMLSLVRLTLNTITEAKGAQGAAVTYIISYFSIKYQVLFLRVTYSVCC